MYVKSVIDIRYIILYVHPARVLSPLRGGGRGGIEYLNDPDSYAGWSFYTTGRASQARQVQG